MFSSVLATFDESRTEYVRTVMHELKKDEGLNVKGIVYGRLFSKLTASIIVPEVEINTVFEKLLANGINIYAFNDDYKERIEKVSTKLKSKNGYVKDKVRSFYNSAPENYRSNTLRKEKSKESSPELVHDGNILLPEKETPARKKEVKPNFEFVASQQGKVTNQSLIDKYCSEGDYVSVGNIVKKNPVMNSYAKEKYIPAIKNCIKIQMEKGLENRAYVETAIVRLKDILCNKEICAITSEDLISSASNALIAVCSAQDPEKLILLANLANVGQKINVLAFAKLSEIVFESKEEGEVDTELLNKIAAEVNTRLILVCYDVMETVISETNKTRFNKLYDVVISIKKGMGNI